MHTMFIVALNAITHLSGNTQMSNGNWINKLCNMYTIEYYAAGKSEILQFNYNLDKPIGHYVKHNKSKGKGDNSDIDTTRDLIYRWYTKKCGGRQYQMMTSPWPLATKLRLPISSRKKVWKGLEVK